MQEIDKLAHAAKVVALCLPPVVMSLIRLAALSRRKGGATAAGRRPAPRGRSAGSSAPHFPHPGLEIDFGDGASGRSVLGPAGVVAADQFERVEIALGNE